MRDGGQTVRIIQAIVQLRDSLRKSDTLRLNAFLRLLPFGILEIFRVLIDRPALSQIEDGTLLESYSSTDNSR